MKKMMMTMIIFLWKTIRKCVLCGGLDRVKIEIWQIRLSDWLKFNKNNWSQGMILSSNKVLFLS